MNLRQTDKELATLSRSAADHRATLAALAQQHRATLKLIEAENETLTEIERERGRLRQARSRYLSAKKG